MVRREGCCAAPGAREGWKCGSGAVMLASLTTMPFPKNARHVHGIEEAEER